MRMQEAPQPGKDAAPLRIRKYPGRESLILNNV